MYTILQICFYFLELAAIRACNAGIQDDKHMLSPLTIVCEISSFWSNELSFVSTLIL